MKKERKRDEKNFSIKINELKNTIKQFVKVAHFDNKDIAYYVQKWLFKNKIDEYFDIYTIVMKEKFDDWYYLDYGKRNRSAIYYKDYEYDIDYESEFYYYNYNKYNYEIQKNVYKNQIVNKDEEIAGIFLIPKNIEQIINNNQYMVIINAHMDKIETQDIRIKNSDINKQSIQNTLFQQNIELQENKEKLKDKNKKKEKIIGKFKFKNRCVIVLYKNYILQRIDGKPIGGDDRCGITIMLKLLSKSKKYEELRNHVYLFTNYEESGLRGIRYIQNLLNNADNNNDNNLKELKETINKIKNNIAFIIGLDRKGTFHYVNYHYRMNDELKELLEKEYNLHEEKGSISDVKVISEIFDSEHINLAVGFYNSHFSDEIVKIDDLILAYKIVYNLLKNKKDKFLNKKYEAYKNVYYSYTAHSYYRSDDLYEYEIKSSKKLIKRNISEYDFIFDGLKIRNNFEDIKSNIKIYKLFNIMFQGYRPRQLYYIIALLNDKNSISEENTYFMQNKINLYADDIHVKIYNDNYTNEALIYANIKNEYYRVEELKHNCKYLNQFSYFIRGFKGIDESHINYFENNVDCSDLIEIKNNKYKFIGPLEIFADNVVYSNSILLLYNFLMINLLKYASNENNKTIYDILNSDIFFEIFPKMLNDILRNKNILLDLTIDIKTLIKKDYEHDYTSKILIKFEKDSYYSYLVDYELKFGYVGE